MCFTITRPSLPWKFLVHKGTVDEFSFHKKRFCNGENNAPKIVFNMTCKVLFLTTCCRRSAGVIENVSYKSMILWALGLWIEYFTRLNMIFLFKSSYLSVCLIFAPYYVVIVFMIYRNGIAGLSLTFDTRINSSCCNLFLNNVYGVLMLSFAAVWLDFLDERFHY